MTNNIIINLLITVLLIVLACHPKRGVEDSSGMGKLIRLMWYATELGALVVLFFQPTDWVARMFGIYGDSPVVDLLYTLVVAGVVLYLCRHEKSLIKWW